MLPGGFMKKSKYHGVLHSVSRLLMVLSAALIVQACSTDDEAEVYVERPVSELYNAALNLMKEDKFAEAAVAFDEVERQHPYSVWATKAQMMSAYAYYQHKYYDDAIIALDRFIQLHPSNKDVTYAYYLKGLSYYEQISDVTRDQKMTELAMSTLKELVTRFPNSKYARDAKLKIDLTYDHLSAKEMEIGRYYLTQKQYLAAINRFRVVVDKYQTTTHVPEALHRLTESYLALGLNEEARKAAAVLGHNFPGSEWYVDSYQFIEGKQIRKTEEEPWYKVW